MTDPAIPDRAKEWRHCSWSQIEKFRLCPMRWWFSRHRPDIEDPETESLRLGTECHEIAEAHYESREPRNLRYAQHVAYDSTRLLLKDPRLPPKTADLKIEFPEDRNLGVSIAGVPMQGRIDLLWAKSDTHLSIWDWKTLSNWRTAKTEEELERFGQPIIYAYWAFERLKGLKTVDFVHGQILTKKEDCDVVQTRVLDRDHVYGVLPSIERTIEEMKRVFAIEDPRDVPKDTSNCNAFGRPCPYAGVCPKSILAGFDRPNTHVVPNPVVPSEGEVMSLMEKLEAQRAAKAAAAAAATPAPTAAAPAEVTKFEKPAAAKPPSTAKRATQRATGINPPDAASATPAPAAATTDATPAPVGDPPGLLASTIFKDVALYVKVDGALFRLRLEPAETIPA